jgi:hypothetical protein
MVLEEIFGEQAGGSEAGQILDTLIDNDPSFSWWW